MLHFIIRSLWKSDWMLMLKRSTRYFDGVVPACSAYLSMMSPIARIISPCMRIAVFGSMPAVPPIIGQLPIIPFIPIMPPIIEPCSYSRPCWVAFDELAVPAARATVPVAAKTTEAMTTRINFAFIHVSPASNISR
ncbi:hypothetical protein BN2476_130084 [Paraburkholderia piptadeniae]|uniref:Uncharacterized protein n=1 Tax=Paraburkholderia piptadeniae TaxID=1701573 RepID=A0A1N7RRM4_9BURK|nr:hypothetical protein BN2476_130084 [Paraburkholderia piptadeniae]